MECILTQIRPEVALKVQMKGEEKKEFPARGIVKYLTAAMVWEQVCGVLEGPCFRSC
jgi:hypothetical protein